MEGNEAELMSVQRDILILAAACGVLILLSLLGLVWAFLAGLLYPHILLDGLLLVAICLLLGGVFSIMLYQIARAQGWLKALAFWRKKQPVAEAPVAEPSRQTAEEGK